MEAEYSGLRSSMFWSSYTLVTLGDLGYGIGIHSGLVSTQSSVSRMQGCKRPGLGTALCHDICKHTRTGRAVRLCICICTAFVLTAGCKDRWPCRQVCR